MSHIRHVHSRTFTLSNFITSWFLPVIELDDVMHQYHMAMSSRKAASGTLVNMAP